MASSACITDEVAGSGAADPEGSDASGGISPVGIGGGLLQSSDEEDTDFEMEPSEEPAASYVISLAAPLPDQHQHPRPHAEFSSAAEPVAGPPEPYHVFQWMTRTNRKGPCSGCGRTIEATAFRVLYHPHLDSVIDRRV